MSDKLPSIRMPLDRGGKTSREFATYLEKIKHDVASSPIFATVKLTDLTASLPVVTDASKYLESKTYADFLSGLSGEAAAAFSWNGKALTNVGTIGSGAITSTGTSRMAVLGVGLARTDGTLHVHTATAGAVAAHANFDDLVIENSAAGGIGILGPDSTEQGIAFNSPSNSQQNWIGFGPAAAAADGYLRFVVGNVERVRLSGTGNVGIGVTTWGTSAAKVLGMANATAPTTSPANMIQLLSLDRSAGYAQLHYMAEGGLVRPLQQVFNVMDYGAANDGTNAGNATTLAIQAASDACAAGGILYFPTGTYLTRKFLVYSYTHVQGAGMYSTVIKLDAAQNDSPVIYNENHGPTVQDYKIVISDLTVDGSKGDQASGSGNYGAISMRGVDDLQLYNCQVKDHWGFAGIYSGGGSNVSIHSNHVHNNKNSLTIYGNGIYVTGYTTAHRSKVWGNVCHDNEYAGILIEDIASDANVFGNTCYNNKYGILNGNTPGTSIVSNRCFHNTTCGIISNNTFSDYLTVANNFVGGTRGWHDGGDHATTCDDESNRVMAALGIIAGLTAYNLTDGSSGTVTSTSGVTFTVDDLTGGTDDTWQDPDQFLVIQPTTISLVGSNNLVYGNYGYEKETTTGAFTVIGASGEMSIRGGTSLERRDTNGNAALYINWFGYNGGNTQFRDLDIRNGKGSSIAIFDGSTANLWVGGDVGIGVLDPHSALEVNGAISSETATITASSDATDVSGINTLFIDPAAAVVIGAFVGGVNGQELRVVVIDDDQNVTLEHNEGTGNQNIFLHKGLDETIDSHYGGWNLICNGSSWYDESHAKHV